METICPRCQQECSLVNDNSDDLVSVCCGSVVRFRCTTCGGGGHVEEADYYGDYINFGSWLITCPDCRGDGWTDEWIG